MDEIDREGNSPPEGTRDLCLCDILQYYTEAVTLSPVNTGPSVFLIWTNVFMYFLFDTSSY